MNDKDLVIISLVIVLIAAILYHLIYREIHSLKNEQLSLTRNEEGRLLLPT